MRGPVLQSLQDIIGRLKGQKAILVPHVDLDSLIATGILADYLESTGGRAYLSLNLSYTKLKLQKVVLVGFPPGSQESDISLITRSEGGSLSASIYRITRQYLSDPVWTGKLVLVAGEYAGLNDTKKGFTGMEKEVFEELREGKNKGAVEEYGFRLWGWGRRRLVDQMLRTLIPFMPGVTGNIEGIQKIISKIPGVTSLEEATSSTVFSATQPERARHFLESLLKTVKLTDEQKKRLTLRLVGHIYYIDIHENMIDIPEVMGAIMVFMSLGSKNPLLVPLMVRHKHVLYHILLIYNKVIDELSIEIADAYDKLLNGKSIEGKFLHRPELLRDILVSVSIPYEKPIAILGEKNYTSASELLTMGYDFDDVAKKCNVYQLCVLGKN